MNQETLLTPWQMKCLEFIEHYLSCFNASEACRRMGYEGASASSQGWEFLHHEFTQKELSKRYAQHAEENKAARNEIIMMLYREANYFGEGASHGARVRAQVQLSKVFGMEQISIRAELEHKGGVMLVPMAQSVEEWESLAAQQQSNLMDETINII
ncbi:terminase small subunit [Akkermansiaceae bacterium]|nr:terminase small subunit [Akkermansiaceae bacterium]